MKIDLLQFQQDAVDRLRDAALDSAESYAKRGVPQVISFTAPTGAGKTLICASLIENIYGGDTFASDSPDTIFIWLSDSPDLNEQSRAKIENKTDSIRLGQCVTVNEDTFDRETFEDGHIYFLNTQKLGKTSKLTKHGDARQYTIWETIANTVREKGDRLITIIDEAHRGMQGTDAGRATTIMQKFIKGTREGDLIVPPMPVVIGMSATVARFDKLVAGTTSTIHSVKVAPEDVRDSGLLKDRILITYTDADAQNTNPIALLQAAAENWRDKCDRWEQYCRGQHLKHVSPVLVVQVQSGTGGRLTDTDLDDCIATIEERAGLRFREGQVVHTFGQTTAAVMANGLAIPYVEPQRIEENRAIKVVLFKENLSTGWDCPRAETMMSFRRAKDATYIAQLLGRMIRTPLHMHITLDDTLNDVTLFLPYFDQKTVEDIVDALQTPECGNIPTVVVPQPVVNPTYITVTVKPKKPANHDHPGQTAWTDPHDRDIVTDPDPTAEPQTQQDDTHTTPTAQPAAGPQTPNPGGQQTLFGGNEQQRIFTAENTTPGTTTATPATTDPTTAEHSTRTPALPRQKPQPRADARTNEREAVIKHINQANLISYSVNIRPIKDYIASLLDLARLLTQEKIAPGASAQVIGDIVGMMRSYIDKLKANGQYDELAANVMQFKLTTRAYSTYEIYTNTVKDEQLSIFGTSIISDAALDRQYRDAEAKLKNEGIGTRYGELYDDPDDPAAYKRDVIIYAGSEECEASLKLYAEDRFHNLADAHRRAVNLLGDEKITARFNRIIAGGDAISKKAFILPESLKITNEKEGSNYKNHLYVREDTDTYPAKLNAWESAVIEAESKRPDFLYWLRNCRSAWGLCIPYTIGDTAKEMYPDFIIIRRDGNGGYITDILEPHGQQFADNLPKARGLARYAEKYPAWGRIQLIRADNNVGGVKHLKRLDMTRSQVRKQVLAARDNDDLTAIFEHCAETD